MKIQTITITAVGLAIVSSALLTSMIVVNKRHGEELKSIRATWEQDAITAGAGEYYLDFQNEREFRLVSPPQRSDWERAAIDEDVAEYFLDVKGERGFRFIPPIVIPEQVMPTIDIPTPDMLEPDMETIEEPVDIEIAIPKAVVEVEEDLLPKRK